MALINNQTNEYLRIELPFTRITTDGICCSVICYKNKEDRIREKQLDIDLANYFKTFDKKILQFRKDLRNDKKRDTFCQEDFIACSILEQMMKLSEKGEKSLLTVYNDVTGIATIDAPVLTKMSETFGMPREWHENPIRVSRIMVNCADYNKESFTQEDFYPLLKKHFYGKESEDTSELLDDDL